MEYEFESMLRSHHVSKIFWTPVIGEILVAATEDENRHDKLAVVLSSPEVGIVGHVPRKCSLVCFITSRIEEGQ